MDKVIITVENCSFQALYSREYEGFVLYYREMGDGFLIDLEADFFNWEGMYDFIKKNLSNIIPKY